MLHFRVSEFGRGRILERKKKEKEEESFEFYSKGMKIGVVSISRGSIVLELQEEDDGVTGAVSKIALNIRRKAIKLQLVRLTIQSLDCNDPPHCFGTVTINEKLPATDLLQLSRKYQPIQSRLHPFRTACGSIRTNRRTCFVAFLQKRYRRLP